MRLTIILALILLIPVASATITLPVSTQSKQTVTYNNQNTETYNWILTNPPFNFTSGVFTNDTLSRVYVRSDFLADPQVTGTRTYSVVVEYNNTHSYKMDFQYQKYGWGIFGYFQNRYVLYKDGEIYCQDSSITVAPSMTPSPYFIFDFGLHGSFSATTGAPSFGAINVSGEVLYNNPSLFLTWSDRIGGPLDFFSNTFSNPLETSPCPAHSIGGQVFGEGIYEMTGAPTLTMFVDDNTRMTHKIEYEFQNNTVQLTEVRLAIDQINDKINSCIGPTIIGICVVDFLGQIISIIFNIATLPIRTILQFIPGFDILEGYAKIGFNFVAEIVRMLLAFTLLSHADIPPAGVFIMLSMWNVALGILIFAATGNPWHIIGLAYWFAKIYVTILFWLVVGPVLIAIEIYKLIAQAIP